MVKYKMLIELKKGFNRFALCIIQLSIKKIQFDRHDDINFIYLIIFSKNPPIAFAPPSINYSPINYYYDIAAINVILFVIIF